MRYRLRTLLIVLALGPPLLACAWMVAWVIWITAWDLYYILSIPSGIKGLS